MNTYSLNLRSFPFPLKLKICTAIGDMAPKQKIFLKAAHFTEDTNLE